MTLPTGRKVTVVGCGKLGLPLVSVLSQAGHDVIGFDRNEQLINHLNAHNVPWFEAGLEETVREFSHNMKFTTSLSEATRECSVALVIVPTPSDTAGWFRSEYVEQAVIDLVQSRLETSIEPLLIVIISTLMPGSTRKLRDSVKRLAGEKSHLFKIVYSPEFIALGTVVEDMKNPSLVLIGSDDDEATETYQELVDSYVSTAPFFARLTFEGAEIAKIGVNSYVTMKISFANFISELCDLNGNSSANEVLEAIGSDKRIGRAYLKPGTPFGGPCFPRDNVALARFGESIGASASLPLVVHEYNEAQVDRIARFIDSFFPPGLDVLLVGMAYKPGTAVTEESASLKVMRRLEGIRKVYALDSYLSVQDEFPNNHISREMLRNFRIGAVLMVPDESYDDIPSIISSESYLLDCWGTWVEHSSKFQNQYRRLGDPRHV